MGGGLLDAGSTGISESGLEALSPADMVMVGVLVKGGGVAGEARRELVECGAGVTRTSVELLERVWVREPSSLCRR